MNENVDKFMPAFKQFWEDLLHGIPENGNAQRKHNHIYISNDPGNEISSFQILESDLEYLYKRLEEITNRVQLGVPTFFDPKGVYFDKPVYFKFYTSDQKIF